MTRPGYKVAGRGGVPGTREQAGAGRQWKRVEEGSRAKIWEFEGRYWSAESVRGSQAETRQAGFSWGWTTGKQPGAQLTYALIH